MRLLIVLNDPPYGSERTYNGLRLALNLLTKAEGISLTVFLMGDAVATARAGQQTRTPSPGGAFPTGYRS